MSTKQEDPSQNRATDAQAARPQVRAFSLIELLIVVAIIVILVALIVVGLQRVQVAAARTESANALRQMMSAYHGYSGDNNNRLMPGYVQFDDLATKHPNHPLLLLSAKMPNGEWMVPQQQPNNAKYLPKHDNIRSYVWRLAPYLADGWRVMMTDYRDRGVVSYFESQVDQEIFGPADEAKLPTVASAPSFGLNSIFFGGDNRRTLFDFSNTHDFWNNPDNEPRRVATRAAQVRNTQAIVFAPVAAADNSATDDQPYLFQSGIGQFAGYPELRPPFIDHDGGMWTGRQWLRGVGGRIQPGPDYAGAKGAGLPIVRHGRDLIPVASFDGSAKVLDLGEIERDMRRWSPFQTGTNVPPADVQP